MPTFHMITALILFNWFLAFGTIFGVEVHPLDIFTLSGILILPGSPHLTVTWLMILLTTFKAKYGATFTLYTSCN